MSISNIQDQALKLTPLFLCQSEYDLNRIVWVDNLQTKDFRRSTIDALINKGLLEYNKTVNNQDELDHVVLTEKSIKLGYKATE